MSDWIQAKDRMPENSDIFCIIYARDDYEFAWWHEGSGSWDSPDEGWIGQDEVLCWFPLPAAPEKYSSQKQIEQTNQSEGEL